jgi:hypothetical protein
VPRLACPAAEWHEDELNASGRAARQPARLAIPNRQKVWKSFLGDAGNAFDMVYERRYFPLSPGEFRRKREGK